MRPLIAVAASTCICLCCSTLVSAQSHDSPLAYSRIQEQTDSKPSLASRVWKSEIARTVVAGVALTRIAAEFNRPSDRILATHGVAGTSTGTGEDSYGGGYLMAALSGAAWGYGALSHRQDIRETGTSMMKGLLLDAFIVTSLRETVGRSQGNGSGNRPLISGSASGAFTLSTIISRRHGLQLGIPAFGLASAVAISDLEGNRHKLSEVVAGAVLGVAIGQLVTPKPRGDESGLQVIAGPSKVGLRLKF